jgi:hypothetical protein
MMTKNFQPPRPPRRPVRALPRLPRRFTRPLPRVVADTELSKSSGPEHYWTAEWVTAFGTAVTALFTFALAIFALWAWLESKHASDIFQDQLKEAQKQTASVQLQLQEARRQSDAAQDQIEEMRKQSKAAQEQTTIAREGQRPWIMVQESPPEVSLGVCLTNCAVVVKLKLHNVGHAPAYSVISSPMFWNGSTSNLSGATTAVEAQKAQCERGTPHVLVNESEWVQKGRTLFPDQIEDRDVNIWLTTEEWKTLKVNKEKDSHGGSFGTGTILGCVQYAYDGVVHRTMFAYEIHIGADNRTPWAFLSTIRLDPINVPQLWSAD